MADPKEPENSKPKKSGYLVCDGAMCKCDSGAAPAKIKVTKNTKIYINNEKLLVTETDTIFTPPSGTFGVCSKKPPQANTCVPVFQPKWTKPYDSIETAGGKVITDKSELQCTVGGKVTIVMHGQVQVVSPAQAENQDKKIATQVNALADPAKSSKKVSSVSVQAITGEVVPDPKFEPVTSQVTGDTKSAKIKDTDAPDLFLRPGQKAKFTATYTGTEPLVCWKLQTPENPDPIYFLRQGKEFTTAFNELGKYRIEGYGTGTDGKVDAEIYEGTDVTRVENSKCVLEIVVGPNKLTGLKHLASDNVIVSGKKEIQARAGVPISFEPVFLMPAVQEDIENLVMVVNDNGGAELFREASKPTLTYTPENTDCAFLVEFYVPSDPESLAKLNFRTVKNTVSVIAPKGMKEGESKIRPGCELTFTVSGYKFKGEASAEIQEKENKLIKWYEHSQWHGSNITPVATGKSYTKKYNKERKYIVKCAVNVVSKTWFTSGKDENDDWRFEVTKNYPVGIEQKSTGKIKVGKPASFRLKGIFEIIRADELDIKWNLTGPETKQLEHKKDFFFTLKKLGKYTLTASMNGRPVPQAIEFECIQAEIEKGWWTDADGNRLSGEEAEYDIDILGYAGWDQEVRLAFQHVGLNGEAVNLEVWDSDLGEDDSLLKKEFKVPENGNATTFPITLDDTIKSKVKNKSGWSTAEYGKLYFTVKAKDPITILNDGMSLPQDSNAYLIVDENVKTRAYFSDNNDTKRYTSAELSEPVYVQVKTRGLQKADLELQIVEHIRFTADKLIGKRIPFKVDKYGMASVKVKMDDIKPLVPKASDTIQVSAKIYRKGVEKELLDSSGKYSLTVHKALKTGPVSKSTSKAFVLVDYSEKGKENTVCECQKYDLIWGSKVSCEFRKKVVQISQNLGLPQEEYEGANWLMAVMALETGGTFGPQIGTFKNHLNDNKPGYVGLIQLGHIAVKDLNVKRSELYKMTSEKQLEYVEKYFKLGQFKGKLTSRTDLYLAVNFQTACGKGSNKDYVVYDSSKSYYDDNPSFKKEEDEFYFDKKGVRRFYTGRSGKSYVWEFDMEIGTWATKGLPYVFKGKCNNSSSKNNGVICPDCKKLHKDLLGKVNWQTQFDSKWGTLDEQYVACWKTCQDILINSGLSAKSGLKEGMYQVAQENVSHNKIIVDTTVSKVGVDYINKQLEAEKPVLVGVNHTLNYKEGKLNEGTTDHYVAIIGRGCTEGKTYFLFYEVGTSNKENGTSEKNQLFLNDLDFSLTGTTAYNGRKYIVTQIRLNK